MKIDIYKSIKNGNKYLSVPGGTDVENIQFPGKIDPDILTLSPFKTCLELIEGESYIALDEKDVIEQIKKNGYAIHSAKIIIRIKGN
ncbi:hypothetical protein KQH27_00790 [bacterium]|nr:hypothetical protein [bacterium]